MSVAAPRTEILCIVYGDIARSTSQHKYARQMGQATAFNAQMDRLQTLWRETLYAGGASFFKSLGDGFLATFVDPIHALRAVMQARKALADDPLCCSLPLRIGLHVGAVSVQPDGDILGADAALGARVESKAPVGQIVVSDAYAAQIRPYLPAGYALHDMGLFRLEGFEETPIRLHLLSLGEPVSLPKRPSHLPPERTSFVGRTETLAEIERLLMDGETRLVTVTGIGGVGKSRLALRAAHVLADRFPGGVFFAELAPLTRVEAVLPHLLGIFRLIATPDSESAHHPPARFVDLLITLQSALRGETTLLVLDNVEHLEGIEEVILCLLDTCPSLRILTTSRVTLSLWAQPEIALPPLEQPDPEAPVDRIQEVESVRLFVRRAQSVDSAFALTADNARAVADICRIVGGIPLGIELVARMIRTRDPKDIATRLQYQLLDVEARTPELPKRQQSLRAAFEYSYRMLPPAPRALLSCLIVFRGGFTAEAAEEVCRGQVAGEVNTALETLIDHSWVERTQTEGRRRLRLLEPVADFVREIAGPLPDELHDAHARYYLLVAQQINGTLHARRDAEAHRQLRRDLENFRAAFRWACNNGEHDVVASMGFALSTVLFEAGFWEEFSAWVGLARRSAEIVGDGVTLCRLATVQGRIAVRRGDPATALEFHQKALRWAEEADNDWARLLAHTNLAEVTRVLGDRVACTHHAEEIIRLSPSAGLNDTVVNGYIHLAALAEQEGRVEEAEQLWERSRALVEAAQDTRYFAYWERERGNVKEEMGDLDGAARFYYASLQRWYTLGLEEHVAQILGYLARLALAQGDTQRCARFLSAAGRLSTNVRAEKAVNDVAQSLRAQVGETAFGQLIDEAGTLSLDEIIEEDAEGVIKGPDV